MPMMTAVCVPMTWIGEMPIVDKSPLMMPVSCKMVIHA